MHLHPNPTLVLLTTLALLPTACFDPGVTDITDGTSSGGEATETGRDSTTSEGSTTVDPDDSSGAPLAVCGDGVVEGEEVCDDGVNDGGYGGCNADCTAFGPFCGDGVLNGGTEACDDGDDVDGNGCNVDCVVSGTVLWTVTYDGPDHGVDTALGVASDSTDNVIVSGSSTNGGEQQPWLRKYSPEGSPLWTADIGSPGNGAGLGPVASLVDDDIVVGGGFDPGAALNDAWILRVSGTGQTVWSQPHAGPQGGWDHTRDVDVDTDGYIYALVEEGNAATETGYRTFLRKYSPDGSELWTRAQEDNERAVHMAVNAQDRVILAGTTVNGGVEQPWLQLKDSDGVDLWTQTPSLAGDTSPDAIAMNSNGDIAIAISPSGASPRIVRLTPDGVETPAAIFPHPASVLVTVAALHLDDNGNVIAGGTLLVDDETAQGWVSKYDADDSELWTNIHDGEYDNALSWDAALSIAVDTQGNVLAAGTIHSAESSLRDIWLGKYAP